MAHRLVWTDSQKQWLKNQLGILDSYTRMTTLVEMQRVYRHEIGMLQAVQAAVLKDTPIRSAEVAAWEWWAFWYSACWVATRFSPAPEHAAQFDESMTFRNAILTERLARLSALKHAPHALAGADVPYRMHNK